ncbi:immunoglobulin superfamily member 10-like [Dysidea avara]|uniref:immunoglobulin superfamily member 10-like n=1 Tax=Dysidea avara TaxID=196820 RepID=UPI00331C18A8
MSQERRNLLCIAVYIVVVMVIRSHALISVSRTLIIPTTDYAKFCCRSTSDSGSNEPVEWLNSNLDVLTTTDKIRIRTSSRHPTCKSSLQFRPPSISVAGSYWCRKVNSNDKVEVKLVIESEMETKQTIAAGLGSNVYLDCPNHNSTISWAINRTNHINFTTELSYSQNMSGMVIHNITTKQKGDYTCYSEEDAIGYAMIKVITEDRHSPHFIYSSNPTNRFFSDEQTALCYQDNFINCSFTPTVDFSNSIYWDYRGRLLNTFSHPKYSHNTSGLMIYNFTEADQGIYKCLIGNGDPLIATISVTLVWPPELPFTQNKIVLVNVSEQVVLNCTVSSSPDPVYNWSIPDTCSSCPHTNNDSVMIFTADITDSGKYVCEAGNKYGSVYHNFDVKVISKPSPITRNTTTIIKDCKKDNNNVVLTCGIYYPSAVVKWNIMMDSSTTHHSVEESSTGKYIVHNNGSLEVHHRYVSDNDHLIFMCSADNMNGSIEHVFHVWDHNAFYQACSVKSVKTDVEVKGKTATITFSVIPSHPDVNFHCKLNNRNYKICTSPMIYHDLSIRSHRVTIQAACVGQSSWQTGKVRFKIKEACLYC